MAHQKYWGFKKVIEKLRAFASRRTMNRPQGPVSHADNPVEQKAFQQHDPANRMGSFEGRGNHARTGNRGHQ